MSSRRLSPEQIRVWRNFITLHALIIEKIEAELRLKQAIPLNWYDVLFALWETHERKLTPNQLSTSVILSKSTLTRILDRLEEKKLIRRETSKADKRSYQVALTDAGLDAMKKAWTIYSRNVDLSFTQFIESHGLSAEFSKTLSELLNFNRSKPEI